VFCPGNEITYGAETYFFSELRMMAKACSVVRLWVQTLGCEDTNLGWVQMALSWEYCDEQAFNAKASRGKESYLTVSLLICVTGRISRFEYQFFSFLTRK
jgi:hypothetical protein